MSDIFMELIDIIISVMELFMRYFSTGQFPSYQVLTLKTAYDDVLNVYDIHKNKNVFIISFVFQY